MVRSSTYIVRLTNRRILVFMACILIGGAAPAWSARPFTVEDDIGFTNFGDPYSSLEEPISYSPDGRLALAIAQRGRLDINRPESIIRVYRIEELRKLLGRQGKRTDLSPLWEVRSSAYENGPNVRHVQWLANSSGFAFLQRTAMGTEELVLVDLGARMTKVLTPADRHVTAFAILDKAHYVYSLQSQRVGQEAVAESRATSIVGTGRDFFSLVYPNDKYPENLRASDFSELWAVVAGAPFLVTESDGRPMTLHVTVERSMALAPDGQSIIVEMPVANVPAEWSTQYPPPWPSSPSRIQAGPQNVESATTREFVSQFVEVTLATGHIRLLTSGPTGGAAGWWSNQRADWASDGRSLILTSVFLPPDAKPLGRPSTELDRPCVAALDLDRSTASCIELLTGQTNDGAYASDFSLIEDSYFVSGANNKVVIRHRKPDGSKFWTGYTRGGSGLWQRDPRLSRPVGASRGFEVSVRQGLNTPPILVATDLQSKRSEIIWNPNPQLNEIDIATASVFQWNDKTGRNWVGGLYRPVSRSPRQRFPLVIQTHGFDETRFEPSGIFPSAFAAQALAAAGLVVLQVRDCPIRNTPEEAPCQIAGYESAIARLTDEGLVDPDRIGIVGFSRTCYYVMEALTRSSLKLKAASITDGINFGYFEYVLAANFAAGAVALEADKNMGARPFGEGLKRWLERSPEFNLDRVHTPLQIVALSPESVLPMWEPYAMLQSLRKPVDLIVLVRPGTHVLTNPAQRKVSQGGTVDWMRFWLQGYEDPDDSKSNQYKRWRELRTLQQSQK
jgi:dipeptidyl aminopeptidase/acylaminoacyl peptidase